MCHKPANHGAIRSRTKAVLSGAWIKLNPAKTQIEIDPPLGTIKDGKTKTINFTLVADDTSGNMAQVVIYIALSPVPNNAPTVNSAEPTRFSMNEGDTKKLNPASYFTDNDPGDSLGYYLLDEPDWIVLDSTATEVQIDPLPNTIKDGKTKTFEFKLGAEDTAGNMEEVRIYI